MRRSACSMRRSSAPNGETSTNTSHSQPALLCSAVAVYSGTLSANRLTSLPLAVVELDRGGHPLARQHGLLPDQERRGGIGRSVGRDAPRPDPARPRARPLPCGPARRSAAASGRDSAPAPRIRWRSARASRARRRSSSPDRAGASGSGTPGTARGSGRRRWCGGTRSRCAVRRPRPGRRPPRTAPARVPGSGGAARRRTNATIAAGPAHIASTASRRASALRGMRHRAAAAAESRVPPHSTASCIATIPVSSVIRDRLHGCSEKCRRSMETGSITSPSSR